MEASHSLGGCQEIYAVSGMNYISAERALVDLEKLRGFNGIVFGLNPDQHNGASGKIFRELGAIHVATFGNRIHIYVMQPPRSRYGLTIINDPKEREKFKDQLEVLGRENATLREVIENYKLREKQDAASSVRVRNSQKRVRKSSSPARRKQKRKVSR